MDGGRKITRTRHRDRSHGGHTCDRDRWHPLEAERTGGRRGPIVSSPGPWPVWTSHPTSTLPPISTHFRGLQSSHLAVLARPPTTYPRRAVLVSLSVALPGGILTTHR